MRSRYILFIVMVSFCLHVTAQPPLRLWYNRPATQWIEALPVGNGRIGAMVFGGVEEEVLVGQVTGWKLRI